MPERREGQTTLASDLLGVIPLAGEGGEGLELIGRVHGLPDDILGQADLRPVLGAEHVAGDGIVLSD